MIGLMEQESIAQKLDTTAPPLSIQAAHEKKFNTLTILGVAIVVIGALLLSRNSLTDTETPVNEHTFSNTSLSIAHAPNPKAFQYFEFVLPVTSGNVVQCEDYQSYELQTRCWQSLAVLKKDPSYCNNIKPSLQTGSMHRDTCYLVTAKETGNVRLCENIENRDALTGEYVNCVASLTQDISLCPSLKPPDYYNGSFSCYLSVASAKKDVSICDAFENDTDSKQRCYAGVAVAKSDSSVCDIVSLPTDKRDGCYMNFLADSGIQDVSVCEKIHDAQLRLKCTKTLERTSISSENNIAACDSFADKDERESCFWEMATAQDNPLFCEKIPDELWVGQCIIQSSAAITSATLCNELSRSHYGKLNKDTCLFQYATVNQKSESCKEITNPDLKTNCLKQLYAH